MVNLRLLAAMTLGALVAALGALFLGEYEFDETLPIVAGPLLGLIVAEIVVSIGKHRSATMAVILASWAAVAVLLAGHIDANDVESVKAGAYLSAGLAALAAGLRATDWSGLRKGRQKGRTGRQRGRSASSEQAESTTATRSPVADS